MVKIKHRLLLLANRLGFSKQYRYTNGEFMTHVDNKLMRYLTVGGYVTVAAVVFGVVELAIHI